MSDMKDVLCKAKVAKEVRKGKGSKKEEKSEKDGSKVDNRAAGAFFQKLRKGVKS